MQISQNSLSAVCGHLENLIPYISFFDQSSGLFAALHRARGLYTAYLQGQQARIIGYLRVELSLPHLLTYKDLS